MNAEEKIKLIQLLVSSGVTYFKCAEFELRIDSQKAVSKPHIDSKPQLVQEPPLQQFDPDKTDKVLKAIELLQLKDEELANKIFPAGAM